MRVDSTALTTNEVHAVTIGIIVFDLVCEALAECMAVSPMEVSIPVAVDVSWLIGIDTCGGIVSVASCDGILLYIEGETQILGDTIGPPVTVSSIGKVSSK